MVLRGRLRAGPTGPRPWSADDARNNAGMWAPADESRKQIVGMYRQARAHADETILADLRYFQLVPFQCAIRVLWPPPALSASTLRQTIG